MVNKKARTTVPSRAPRPSVGERGRKEPHNGSPQTPDITPLFRKSLRQEAAAA
jgi:hypothetical protein